MKGAWMCCLLLTLVIPGFTQSGCGFFFSGEAGDLPRRLQAEQYVPPPGSDSTLFYASLENWLSDLYREGYLEARIDSIRADNDCHMAWVFAGSRLIWGKLAVPAGLQEDFRQAGLQPGRWVSKPVEIRRWVRANEQLVEHYENRGYPFARSFLEQVQVEGQSLEAVWILEKGPFYRFDSLVVRGSAGVRPNILARHLGIIRDREYSEKQLEQVSSGLAEWAFLKEIRPAEAEFYPGEADIYIYADRQPASRFNGIAGLAPAEPGSRGVRLTGELDLNLQNMLGRAENLVIRWRKPAGQSQDLKLSVSWPYLFASPIGLQAGFDLYRRDTSWLNLDFMAGMMLRGSRGQTWNLNTRYFESDPVGTSGVLSESIRRAVYGLGWSLNRIDRPVSPSRGYSLRVEAGLGTKTLRSEETGEEVYLSLEGQWMAEYYLKLPGSFTALLAHRGAYRNAWINGAASRSDYESELYRMGGYSSIRGFGEDAFLASRYALFTLELRYVFEEYSYFSIFSDGGYLGRFRELQWEEEIPAGFGTGLTLGTGAGIFSLSWALGSRQGNPLRLSESLIHIGYLSLF